MFSIIHIMRLEKINEDANILSVSNSAFILISSGRKEKPTKSIQRVETYTAYILYLSFKRGGSMA